MAFSDRFPDDMMRAWGIDRERDSESESTYDKCKRALDAARAADADAYTAMFGTARATSAAAELHALRYGSADDERRAMAYGPDPVVSVVACMLDNTPLTSVVPPRLIDRAAIETIPDLDPIVRAVRALFVIAVTEAKAPMRAPSLAAVVEREEQSLRSI